MSLRLARQAVDAYLRILAENGSRHAEVHFFGGEPFFAEEVVHFVVNYARCGRRSWACAHASR